jgi:transcriptional regulator with GAF, ATPase, and Fis domain
MLITGRTLFAFVDPKDPFTPGEVAGEEQAGPILSLMAARQFDFLFLFHTPHTRGNAAATHDEVRRRYAKCQVMMRELAVSDPKDYSSLMGRLAREVREITRLSRAAENSVCVSSGTAEMRAAWFLLTAVGALPATLLQVGSPADPLFGAANVKEVSLNTGDWKELRDLVMPQEYFRGGRAARDLAQECRATAQDHAHAFAEIAERMAALVARILLPKTRRRPTEHLPPSSGLDDTLLTPLTVADTGVPRDAEESASETSPEARDSDKTRVLELQQECLSVLQDASRLVEEARARARDNTRAMTSITEQMTSLALPMPFSAEHRPTELPSEPPGLEDALQELGIITRSAVLRRAAESAAIAAESEVPVLVLGETGTGKELIARLIHRMSSRREREMVTVNCAAIPKELAESFLFGHVKGAFTGANGNQKGKFEHADGSTLFLDELAELTPEVQGKLLRVVEDFKVEPLGSNTPRKVDVRILAATNHNLERAVAEGRFRADLYYRLKVFPITLPPLRDRQGEIPSLAAALLKRLNDKYKRQRQLSKEAFRRLEQHDWPGNVRELASVLEHAFVNSRSNELGVDDLKIESPPAIGAFAGLPEPKPGFLLEEFLKETKKHLINRALAKTGNNQSAAAELLGVSKQAINKFVHSTVDNSD